MIRAAARTSKVIQLNGSCVQRNEVSTVDEALSFHDLEVFLAFAEVEHQALTDRGRNEGCDRRPVNARQCFQHQFRHRHQRASVAGRDDAVGLADRLEDFGDRRFRLGTIATDQAIVLSVPEERGVEVILG